MTTEQENLYKAFGSMCLNAGCPVSEYERTLTAGYKPVNASGSGIVDAIGAAFYSVAAFRRFMAEMKRQQLRANVAPVRGYTERVERGLNAYIVHSDGTIFQFLTGPKGRCDFYRKIGRAHV